MLPPFFRSGGGGGMERRLDYKPGPITDPQWVFMSLLSSHLAYFIVLGGELSGCNLHDCWELISLPIRFKHRGQ